jgi:hypothetical protein
MTLVAFLLSRADQSAPATGRGNACSWCAPSVTETENCSDHTLSPVELGN